MITIHTATDSFPLDEVSLSYIEAIRAADEDSDEAWQLREMGLKGWRDGVDTQGMDEATIADMMLSEAEQARFDEVI